MEPMKRSAAQSADRIRGGAATATGATAAGRLRKAAVLCSLVFAAFWLPGCAAQVVAVKPEVTITAATDLREAGTPLAFTVRVTPAPATGMSFGLEINVDGCMLPEQLQLPRNLTIDSGAEEVTFTVPTDGIEMVGEEGCALTVRLTEGDTAHTVQVTVLLKNRRQQGGISS